MNNVKCMINMNNPKNMNNMNNQNILIDMKEFRIWIQKHVLEAIGNPEYIRLAYQPKTKRLVIFNDQENQELASKLQFEEDGTCYVLRKGFLSSIRNQSEVLVEDEVYLVDGKLSDTIPAVSFPLEKARVVNEDGMIIPAQEDQIVSA